MTVHCFTSVTNNYIPKARILAKSLKRHNPDWVFHVVLNEPLADGIKLEDEPFDSFIPIEELGIPNLHSWIFQHKVTEICTAVKGHASHFLFEKMGAQKVVYLDPDIAVFDSLQPIADWLEVHPIILAPHQTKPDKQLQDIINNEIGSLRWGVFNLGFFAVARYGQGLAFIDWWKERLMHFCRDDIPFGLFTDQRWCDLVPAFFDELFILRDSGYDVATWNLTHREVRFGVDGSILVDGSPLRFYHFSGYDSGAGSWMVEFLESNIADMPVREIWDWYDRQLSENEQSSLGRLEWFYDRFDNGEKITNEMRLVYRNQPDLRQEFDNPFDTNRSDGGFYGWWLYQYHREDSQPEVAKATSSAIVYANYLKGEENDKPAEYIPLSTESVDGAQSLIKLIAFYLPQFHPIPENDVWWGKGFTEWTNVSKAVPQFAGHYQPHLPGELGFYDLRLIDIQKRQIELAKQYGFYGFGFYYYWFAGKRLLERPVEQFLSNRELDFPFLMVWANENWTRRWEGDENEVLMRQVHTPETDIEFIKSIEPYMRDERYIRIGDRPVLIIYRFGLMPDPAATVDRWREYCVGRGLGNPYIMLAQTFGFYDPRPFGSDAAVQFPPHNQHYLPRFMMKPAPIFSNSNFQGKIFSYPELVKYKENEPEDPPYTLFKTVFPRWDNEPRKPGRGVVYADSTPTLYKRWLQTVCRWTIVNHPLEERLAFVNAWNEWGEGAHMEPDRRFGYAYLQATMDTLRSL